MQKKRLVFFLLALLFLFPVASWGEKGEQDIERKVEAIVEVFSSPDVDPATLKIRKQTVRQLLISKQKKLGNVSMMDMLAAQYLGDKQTQNNNYTGGSSDFFGSGIEQIVDIINPGGSSSTKRKQKEAILEILTGNPQTAQKVSKKSKRIPENLSQSARIAVSDELGNRFSGRNVVDRNLNTEWAANGSQGKWLQLSWDRPVNITNIILHGTRQVKGSRIHTSGIIVSDGAIIAAGSLKSGQRHVVQVNKQNVTWIKYYIREGQNNVGVSEIEVRGSWAQATSSPSVQDSVAQFAAVSSSADRKHHKKRSSGLATIDQRLDTDWTGLSNRGDWLLFSWEEPIDIENIVLHGSRRTQQGRIRQGFIILSDATVITTGALNPYERKGINVDRKKINWLKYYIMESEGNPRIGEIEITGKAATKVRIAENLAQYGVVRVSDQATWETGGTRAVDMRLDTDWIAAGNQGKWLSLQWQRPMTVSKIVIYPSRNNQKESIIQSDLILSDGSVIPVMSPKNKRKWVIDIERRKLSWLKYYIRRSNGNVRVAEIEVSP